MLALKSRIKSRIAREMSARLGRREMEIKLQHPIISFSFDDFPASALRVGGAILRELEISATYYVSLGLAGSDTPTGRAFSKEDLHAVVTEGHEVGCHTYWHSDAWQTGTAEFEQSVLRNKEAIAQVIPSCVTETLSYPINCPRPATKRAIEKYFGCCRSGGQVYNAGTIDLNSVSAFFLEQCQEDRSVVRRLIDQNASRNGWLIFATHDISEDPTRFGVTPGFFEDVAVYAAQSNATILPVFQSFQLVRDQSM